jgi:hypothetical protein
MESGELVVFGTLVAVAGRVVGLGALVGVGEMAVVSEPQARATAEPPAVIASLLRKDRRDRLPPKILSVVLIVIVPAYCLRVDFVLV